MAAHGNVVRQVERETILNKVTLPEVTGYKIRVFAFLRTSFIVGCGREQTFVLAPAVIAVSPARGATGIPTTALITATFNEVMNPTTINTSTFAVTGPGGTMAGTLTYSGRTATFTPGALLVANSLYTATITTGASDPTGITLTANYVWSFTTGAAADSTPPTVIATVPASWATSISLSQIYLRKHQPHLKRFQDARRRVDQNTCRRQKSKIHLPSIAGGRCVYHRATCR
jgi:Bacterial Ig-like domain